MSEMSQRSCCHSLIDLRSDKKNQVSEIKSSHHKKQNSNWSHFLNQQAMLPLRMVREEDQLVVPSNASLLSKVGKSLILDSAMGLRWELSGTGVYLPDFLLLLQVTHYYDRKI